MQPHTGPFTLTHTQAGCPLTRTQPSLLTSTYPPHNPSTIPSTILGRVNSQSHTESCAPPCWLPLGLFVDVTIHSCAEKSRLGYVQGGVGGLSDTELYVCGVPTTAGCIQKGPLGGLRPSLTLDKAKQRKESLERKGDRAKEPVKDKPRREAWKPIQAEVGSILEKQPGSHTESGSSGAT